MSWLYVQREKPCRPAPPGIYVPREFEDPTCPGAGPGGGSITVAWDDILNKPTEFPPEAHNHDDRYYTRSEMDTLLAYLDATDANLDAEINQRTFFLGSRL